MHKRDEQKILEAARKAFNSQLDVQGAFAALELAKAAYDKALAQNLKDQGIAVVLDTGDGVECQRFFDAAFDTETRHPYAESNAARSVAEVARLRALPQSRKDAIAISWYTERGRQEVESACESAEAAWFEDAAYGRGE